MVRLLAFFAIVCASLLIFGALMASHTPGRMHLRALNAPRLLTVIVGLPDVNDRYRWLSVHGCSAAVTESGAFCTGDFERESSMELNGKKQALVDWRDLPGGTMQVTAMAFDADHRIVARGSIVVFRGH